MSVIVVVQQTSVFLGQKGQVENTKGLRNLNLCKIEFFNTLNFQKMKQIKLTEIDKSNALSDSELKLISGGQDADRCCCTGFREFRSNKKRDMGTLQVQELV